MADKFSNRHTKNFSSPVHANLLDQKLENYLKNLKRTRQIQIKYVLRKPRIFELSKPKKTSSDDDFEDIVGPGRYNPQDKFLSTKTRTPTIKIGKEYRFRYPKLHNKSKGSNVSSREEISRSLNFSDIWAPSFSFKRTGHNLKLVDNIGHPGVGRYTPISQVHPKGYSFKKSERDFNWKKNIRNMYLLAEFEKKFWK